MFSSTSLAVPFVASIVAYLAPRAATALCTRPNNHGRPYEGVRERCAAFADRLNEVGGRKWGFFNAVVLDNAWISVFVLTILARQSNQPWNSQRVAAASLVVLLGSTFCWLFRKAAVTYLPASASAVAHWISPRSIE